MLLYGCITLCEIVTSVICNFAGYISYTRTQIVYFKMIEELYSTNYEWRAAMDYSYNTDKKFTEISREEAFQFFL